MEKIRIVPGLWFDNKLPAEQGASVACREIEVALEMAGSFCVFAYSSLFESVDTEISPPTDETLNKRAVRREKVIPLLRSLAE